MRMSRGPAATTCYLQWESRAMRGEELQQDRQCKRSVVCRA